MDEIYRLFPTPFMRAPRTLPPRLVAALVEHYLDRATQDNSSSPKLVHTTMQQPGDNPLLAEAAALMGPRWLISASTCWASA